MAKVKEFGETVPNLDAEEISVGCYRSDSYGQSHPGVVTDFQLFGRMLTHPELEKWTGCEERLQGDLVSWDEEHWIFQQSSGAIEYLEFEKEVCDLRNKSFHFFPARRGFKKALELCNRVSGQLNE